MIIEGRNAVLEALRARMPIKKILIADGEKLDRILEDIQKRANRQQINVLKRPRRELDAKSERAAHQGVIAEAAPFEYTPLEKVLAKTEGKKHDLILVLDHITDPGNFGAIVRSAEVVGASAVIIPKRRSVAITPAAWKSAAGAFAHLPIVQEANVARVIEKLKSANYWVAGASEHAKKDLWSSPLSGRIALVMGSEGEGLARLTRDSCDFLVKLPQAGKVSSLNVAQAATAISYEWLRQVSLLSEEDQS